MSTKSMSSYGVAEITPEQQAELDKRGLELQIFTGDDATGWRLIYIQKVNGFFQRGETIYGKDKQECLQRLFDSADVV